MASAPLPEPANGRPMNRRRLVAAIGAMAFALPARAAQRPAAFSSSQTRRIDALLRHIQQRLDLAPALAETRWKTMARIEDSASEQTAIDAAGAEALKIGLDAELAARFAQAQIEAGKIIQVARHREWATNPGAAPSRHSTTDPFRASAPEPAFTSALLRTLRDAAGVLRRPGGRRLLDARAADLIHVGGPDLLAGQAALKPLYDIAN
ncbi:MAG: hypothetical protein ABI854_08810 [Betaproteobacteria bacterium]